MRCQFASVIEPTEVCIDLICSSIVCVTQYAQAWIKMFLQLPLQRVCCCMALAGSLGVHTPHSEVGNLPIAILALTSFASHAMCTFCMRRMYLMQYWIDLCCVVLCLECPCIAECVFVVMLCFTTSVTTSTKTYCWDEGDSASPTAACSTGGELWEYHLQIWRIV